MPELVEVELSRRLCIALDGRRVQNARLVDPHASAREPAELAHALRGATFASPRRRGKLLLLDTDQHTLGLHFGMTGRLVLDDEWAIERLVYSSQRRVDHWIRLIVELFDGGRLEIHDPRRLARVFLDPDEDALGPDAATLTLKQFRSVLAGRGRGVAVKARLLDQARVAGVGNLIADEVLWRAGIAPGRLTTSLSDDEVRGLHRQLRATIGILLRRGGSHTGRLMGSRLPGGLCPFDDHPLSVSVVGGRTTYWCPLHQR